MKVKELSLLNYLLIAGARIVGFLHFARILVPCKIVSFRIWTWICPVGWGFGICWLYLYRKVGPPAHKVTCWLWVAVGFWWLSCHYLAAKMVKGFTTLHLSPYWARRTVREGQSDQIISSIWLSQLDSSNCSCGKQVTNPILNGLKAMTEGQLHCDSNI